MLVSIKLWMHSTQLLYGILVSACRSSLLLSLIPEISALLGLVSVFSDYGNMN